MKIKWTTTNVLLVIVAILMSFNIYVNYQAVDIQSDAFVGDLLVQYYTDLNDCFDVAQKDVEWSEQRCVDEINNSELVKRIKKWGGTEYLMIFEETEPTQ